ncbi:MAG: hypothetical protein OXF84_08590 [Bacteroidetes bacterium]|nr:hypothetical protein [Bacteroidota bacterium]
MRGSPPFSRYRPKRGMWSRPSSTPKPLRYGERRFGEVFRLTLRRSFGKGPPDMTQRMIAAGPDPVRTVRDTGTVNAARRPCPDAGRPYPCRGHFRKHRIR